MRKKRRKKTSRDLYEKNEMENNMKGLFSTVKTQLGYKKNGTPQKLIVERKPILSPKMMVNEQMRFF